MRELRQVGLHGASGRVRRRWAGPLLAASAPHRHVATPGLRETPGGLRSGAGGDLRVRRGRGVRFVRQDRLRGPLGRVCRGQAAALRHPSRAATRRERLLRLRRAPQAVPRGQPDVLAEWRRAMSRVRQGRLRPASRRVRVLRAARVHCGSTGASGSSAARDGSPSAPLLHLRAARCYRRPAGRGRHRRASRDAWRAEVIPRLADGARPQSPGGGARSRVDAENGIHGAARGHRAGQRPEAFVARIEAAEVNLIRSSSLLGLLSIALTSAAPARAQTIPPSAYGALRWRLIGPHRGGRVLAVAGVPGDPATFYFGAVDGGVWRTHNAGVTWGPVFDGQPIASVGALAVAPSDANVVYVGTGEASLRSDVTYGAGVYKSTDGGAHWQSLGLADTRHIGKIVVDPRNPDVVLVAALGHAYGPNAERGVFRSTDGGRTWTKVLYKNPDTGAIDLAVDPGDPQVVYAALYQARRTPWEQYPPDEGPGSGLHKSTDGGATWTLLTGHGLPPGPIGRIGLAVGRGSRVYALIGAATGAGLYRSDDGGTTWRLAGTDPRITSRNWYFCRVTVDPQNPDVVYVPNVALLKSSDGGKTFSVLKGQPGGDDYHKLWVDPTSPTRMIVGSDQGAVITLDGGHTWSSWYNQPTAQFYHVVTDDAFPYRVYGAQQDAGTAGIASRSDFGEITFRDWAPVGAGESGYIAPDPLNPDVVYGGDTYGGVHRFDRVTGQSQDVSPWPVSTFGVPMPQRKYRFTWTSPLVFDRVDRHALYLGA